MATTNTMSLNDVVTWATKYNQATSTLLTSINSAQYSSTRRKDIATAQATFEAAMKSAVPTTAQSSVQFQVLDAYTAYQTNLATATTQADRAKATATLSTTLSNITTPTGNTTQVSNASFSLSSLTASNAASMLSPVSNASAPANMGYFAGCMASAEGASQPEIMNAALLGYLMASQASSNASMTSSASGSG